MELWTCVLFVLSLAGYGCGYPNYRQRIPNGNHVPNPCKSSEIWDGVGHVNKKGGGIRNPFGKDFAANGFQWTRALCETDSDNDGMTNGEELGDPNCVWTKDPPNGPARTSEITHPGICDMWNEPKCLQQNSWLDCSTDFKCPVIDDKATKNHTLRMPKTAVPAKETTYICVVLELPSDNDYHIVATTPEIDNINVMHHILVYGCDESRQAVRHAVGEVYDCQMSVDPVCNDIIALWGYGSSGTCLHEDIGFRIGPSGYRKVAMQLHWNNPDELDSYADSSGMNVYYTPSLRPNDAGVFMVGQNYIEIPPKQKEFTVTGTCSAHCSSLKLTDTIHIAAGINHMHYMGKAMKMELLRNNKRETYITDEPVYSYDNPVIQTYDQPIEFRPGDEIKTTCIYNSERKNETTYYGDATSAEMCFGFLMFYPKQNMPSPYCTAWKGISHCEWSKDVIQGCNRTKMFDTSDPETGRIYHVVMANCSPMGPCKRECLPVAEEVKKHPCFHGTDYASWHRRKLTEGYQWMSDTERWNNTLFIAALDSCDAELALKTIQECKRPGETSTAMLSAHPSLIMDFIFLVISYLKI